MDKKFSTETQRAQRITAKEFRVELVHPNKFSVFLRCLGAPVVIFNH